MCVVSVIDFLLILCCKLTLAAHHTYVTTDRMPPPISLPSLSNGLIATFAGRSTLRHLIPLASDGESLPAVQRPSTWPGYSTSGILLLRSGSLQNMCARAWKSSSVMSSWVSRRRRMTCKRSSSADMRRPNLCFICVKHIVCTDLFKG